MVAKTLFDVLKLRFLIGWAGLILIAFSCGDERLSYQINQAPVIDSAFYSHALEAIDRTISREPNNADAYYKKAYYESKLGNVNKATSNINRALILDRNNPQYLILEAQIYLKENEDSLALQKSLLAENLGANSPELWVLISDLYYRHGQYVKALQYINKAKAMHPDGPFSYLEGRCLIALSDTAAAQTSLIKALDQNSYRRQVLIELTKIEQAYEHYDQAFNYLGRNLKDHPSDSRLQRDLGVLYRLTNQPDSAYIIFHHLLEKDTTDPGTLLQMSLTQLQLRRYDSALYYSEKALNFKQDDLEILLTQARIYDQRRYYSSAVQQYEKILTIDSTYSGAREELLKLRGKLAYLRRVAQQESGGLRTISPIKPNN